MTSKHGTTARWIRLGVDFDKIRNANSPGNKAVDYLISEGKELIWKRQKLIRIADKSIDGWKVVDEYVLR